MAKKWLIDAHAARPRHRAERMLNGTHELVSNTALSRSRRSPALRTLAALAAIVRVAVDSTAWARVIGMSEVIAPTPLESSSIERRKSWFRIEAHRRIQAIRP